MRHKTLSIRPTTQDSCHPLLRPGTCQVTGSLSSQVCGYRECRKVGQLCSWCLYNSSLTTTSTPRETFHHNPLRTCSALLVRTVNVSPLSAHSSLTCDSCQ
ncbi:uncharacterized protein YALI1_D05892g [Yarrowia lipolytica]|uniref:Uncharacterized protein n=1 Tax=Yarrowia lipolytica TaxID=4952 RepID=A0A1D8ND92_YARLL|nr:hypothetical protein YALI1_D05892g [Yarrowia lipolytica]